ncbi:MAG: GC-type dockerin domain-anchored protein [Planctomycetota bacterium]
MPLQLPSCASARTSAWKEGRRASRTHRGAHRRVTGGRRAVALLVTVAAVLAAGDAAHADQITWTGLGTPGDWSDPANWSPTGPPDEDDDVVIPNVVPFPELPEMVCVNSITVAGGVTMEGPDGGAKITIKAAEAVVIGESDSPAAICATDGTPRSIHGGGVCIEGSTVAICGTIKAGDGFEARGVPQGRGGSIDICGTGDVAIKTNGGGTVAGGKGGGGQRNGDGGGGVTIASKQGSVTVCGDVRGGDGYDRPADSRDPAGDGGDVAICARGDVTIKQIADDDLVKGGDGGDGQVPGAGGDVEGKTETDSVVDTGEGKVRGGDGGNHVKRDASDPTKKGGDGGDVALKGDQDGEKVGVIRRGDVKGGQGGADDPNDPATPDKDRGPDGDEDICGRRILAEVPDEDDGTQSRSIDWRADEAIALGQFAGRPLRAAETIVMLAPEIDLTADVRGRILDPGVQAILAGPLVVDPGTPLDELVGGTILRDPPWIDGLDQSIAIEPEPCPDSRNSGCDAAEAALGGGVWGSPIGGGVWARGGDADADWYLLSGGEPGATAEVRFDAPFDALVTALDGPTCDAPAVLEAFVPRGEPLRATVEFRSDEIVLSVRPVVLDLDCDRGNRYTAAVAFAVRPPCYADFDGDGELTVFDFLAFQNAFGAGDAAADCDGSGSLNIFDFLCFQNAFLAGCP